MKQGIMITRDDMDCPHITELFPPLPSDSGGRATALFDVISTAYAAINVVAGKDKLSTLDQTPLEGLGNKTERAVLNEIWIALEDANHLATLLTECFCKQGEKP